jgi:Peptidase family M23
MPPLAPRRLTALAGLCLLAVLMLRAPPPAFGAAWRLPVQGRVVRAFDYSPRTPFRAGAVRGVDLRVAAGVPVRAACSGRVTFAGRVPRGGLGVSVRCGRFVATELGLGASGVARGDVVVVGAVVGRAGEGGVVRLGARRVGSRFGYVDPIRLLRRGPAVAPPSAIPLGRAPRGGPPPPLGPETVDIQSFLGPAGGGRPARAPVLAWIGLALLGLGVGGGGLMAAGSLRMRCRPSTSPRRSTT